MPASNPFLNRSKPGGPPGFDSYIMTFRLASTFNDSLLKLNGDEPKAAFDLQLDAPNPAMIF